MSSTKERRSGADRRQAPSISYFPILDSKGHYVECDRRNGIDRRVDPKTSVQFIKANDFLARLVDLED